MITSTFTFTNTVGLGHAHIYTSRLPSTVYGVQIKTESDHALAILYMGSYNQKIQNGEPSPAIFFNLSEFRFPHYIQDTGQYEKVHEIKDLYIAMWKLVFKYFSILLMAFIWIALEHKFEIWVSYCRLLSKVTHNTLILSDDGIVFPSTEIDMGGLSNLSREIHWNLSRLASI